MITITRCLARQVRSVLRLAGIGNGKSIANRLCRVLFLIDKSGLRVRCHPPATRVAVEYLLAGDSSGESVAVPLELLDACQGRKPDPVTIERGANGGIIASWMDSGPQVQEFETAQDDARAGFPPVPDSFVDNPPSLLRAMNDAAAAADREAVRYALDHIQLDGNRGEIVATDGRQVLVQSGYSFAWPGGVLVPTSRVFTSRELARDQPVGVGQANGWVAFQIGPWTIWLQQLVEGRFPDVQFVVRPGPATTRLELSGSDCEFLAAEIPRLPGSEAPFQPVTLALGSPIQLRARGEHDTPVTELALNCSEYHGDPLVVNMDRRYLAQAVGLGFRQFEFRGPEKPVIGVSENQSRVYAWAVLEPERALEGTGDAVRIESPVTSNADMSASPKKRRTNLTARSTPDAPSSDPKPDNNDSQAEANVVHDMPPASTLDQAAELKATLRSATGQVNDLIAALKRQHRKSRLLETTLANLRELKSADAA